MCSTPKGGSSKPLLSSHVESTSGDMSSAEYSNMVQRANECYERRQEELKEYRKTHKKQLQPIIKSPETLTFMDKLRSFLGQTTSSQQLESK